MADIPQDVVRAYIETHYRVDADAGTTITLRIAEPNPLLAALHRRAGVYSSAFITACNPFSQICDAVTNDANQAAMARELEEQGVVFLTGVGQHPSNQWPGEPSFLALGLSLNATRELGVKYGQNAVVWSSVDAVPRLVLLR